MKTNEKVFMENLAKAIREKISNCEVVVSEFSEEIGVICNNFVAYNDVKQKLDDYFNGYEGPTLRIRHNDTLCQILVMMY